MTHVVKLTGLGYSIEMNSKNHIGLRSRDIRQRLGLTQDDIASRAEISKGHLSRFERGEKTLSLAAMLRLAQALETTVGVLVGEDLAKDDIRLIRKGSVQPVHSDDDSGSYTYTPLSSMAGLGNKHSAQIMEISADNPVTTNAFHAGVELLYLLSGRIKIKIGKRTLELDAGDYLEFPGHIPHAIQSVVQESRILIIVVG